MSLIQFIKQLDDSSLEQLKLGQHFLAYKYSIGAINCIIYKMLTMNLAATPEIIKVIKILFYRVIHCCKQVSLQEEIILQYFDRTLIIATCERINSLIKHSTPPLNQINHGVAMFNLIDSWIDYDITAEEEIKIAALGL